MKTRRMGVVTGTRAEYGLLRWLMQEIADDPALELQVYVTGAHLSSQFGQTVREIEKDGFGIDARVPILDEDTSPESTVRALSRAVSGFGEALNRLKPDLMIILGDRYECLGAAQAALLLGIPIVHIHGGEVTEGAFDDAIRHSITKMSYLHFVAAEEYRNRVIQLGEDPGRVFNVGTIGLDNLTRLKLMSQPELEKSIGFELSSRWFLVTYHPETLGTRDPVAALEELLAALDQFPEYHLLFTKPNADPGGLRIAERLQKYVDQNPTRSVLCDSLGQVRYLSAILCASAVVGNSSSGLIEVPALFRPTVNIGNRQQGRLRARSVVDCGGERDQILAAIGLVVSDAFKPNIQDPQSPYGHAQDVSHQIKEALKTREIPPHGKKAFYDLPS